MEFIFPAVYDVLLSTHDKGMQCFDRNDLSLSCSVSAEGKLVMPISEYISAGSLFRFRVKGVVNPNVNNNYQLDILTRYGSDILDFTGNAATVVTYDAP